MGNCMDLLISPCTSPPLAPSAPPPHEDNKIKVIIFNGGEEEFIASTPINHITSGPYDGYTLVHHELPHLPLHPQCKLLPGEVYYLMPRVSLPCSSPTSQKMVEEDGFYSGGGGGVGGCRSVKVVVTKKELVELMYSGKDGVPTEEEFAIRVMDRCRVGKVGSKWKPTLETISELL